VFVTSGAVALGSPISGQPAPNVGGTAQVGANSSMIAQMNTRFVSSLTAANLQNLNVQTVADINTVLDQAQMNVLFQSLISNTEALRTAQTMTERLRASGQLNANQRVIGFQNGQVFVFTEPQRPQPPQR